MPELPLVGVTAVIAGMALFSRDAAVVETSLLRIGRTADQLEAQSAGAFGGTETAFGSMASAVSTGAVIASGALLLAGAGAIKLAADFQQSMALVAAATTDGSEQSKTQLTQLGDYITELSRTGVIGLSDLAEGALELARSGTDIPDIMGGALRAVQELTQASGGEISLKSAADLVANAMHAFGISVQDVDTITTAATVVAQNSTATYTGFGQAVAIAGPSFRAAGFSLNDLAIAETILTRNGLTATTAATALRGVIQRLELPSKAAAKVMEEYGIHLFDAQGKGVGLRGVLEQLNNAFGDEAVASGKLTEEQRATALAQIGLQRTSVALFGLAVGGTAAFDELADSFGRLKASDLSAIVLAPLNSQMQIAVNNVVALGAAFGKEFLPNLQATTAPLVFFLQNIKTSDVKSFADDVLTLGTNIGNMVGSAVTGFAGFVEALGLTTAAGEFLKTTVIGLAVVVLSVLLPPVLAAAAGFVAFLAVIGLATTAIKFVAGVVGGAADAIANWASQFGPLGEGISHAFRIVGDAARSVAALLSGDFTGAAHYANLAIYEFSSTLTNDGGKALDAIGKGLDDVGAQWAPWADQAGTAGTSVGLALTGTHQVVEALAFLLQGNFKAASADAEKALGSFGKAVQPIVDTVRGALTSAFNWLIEVAWPKVQEGAGHLADFLSGPVASTLGDLANTITGDVKGAFAWWNDTGWPGIQAAAEATVNFINDPLLPTVSKIVNIINTDIKAAFDWWNNEGWPGIQAAGGYVVDFLNGPAKDALDGLASKVNGVIRAAFTWLTDEGWPSIVLGAQGVALAVNTQVVPALLSISSTLDGPVKKSTDDFSNKGLPGIVTAAEAVVKAIGSVAEFLGRTADFALKTLDPFGSLAKAWGNLGDAANSIGKALGDLGGAFDKATGATAGGSIVAKAFTAEVQLMGFWVSTAVGVFKLLALVIEGVTAVIALAAADFERFTAGIAQDIAIIRTLGAIVGQFFDDFGTGARRIADDIGPELGRAFSQFGTDTHNALNDAGRDIQTFANDAGKNVGEFFDSLGTGAQRIAQDIGPEIGHAFSEMGRDTHDALTDLGHDIEATFNSIGASLGGFGTVIGGAFSALGAAASAMAADFGAQFSYIGSQAQKTASDIGTAFSGLETILQSAAADMGAQFSLMGTNAQKTASDVGTAFSTLGTTIQTALTGIITAVQTWATNVVAAITTLAGTVGGAAAGVGNAIVDGLIGGLIRRAGEVASQAANLVTSALQAARDAIHAQSPSRDFELLGEDMGEGVNLGLLSKVDKAKTIATSYGDTILAELATFTSSIESASRDIGDKLTDIATKAGDSTTAAIDKMNHDIQTSIDQTQNALNALNGSEADPTSFAVREQALKDQITQEKLAHQQQRQDDDLTYKHSQDLVLADSTYKKNVDLENSKFHQSVLADQVKFENDLNAAKDAAAKKVVQTRHDEAVAAAAVAHKAALDNLALRRTDDIAATNQRFLDAQANNVRQRAIDDAERAYVKSEDAKITDFKQQQLIIERDQKIGSIEDTETKTVGIVQKSADQQRALLLRSYSGKIEDLKDALLDKIPALTDEQAAVLTGFLENVQAQTDQTTQDIVDSMGKTVVASVDSVGTDVTSVLGTGGTVPKAAGITSTAFDSTKGKVDDLGNKMGDVATNQATQIAAVLLKLRDGLLGEGDYAGKGLIKGVLDLVDAIAQLHDKTITITTNYVGGSAPSGSAGGAASAKGSEGSSEEGGGADTSGGGGGGDDSSASPFGGHIGESGPGGKYNNPQTGQPYTHAGGGLITRPTLLMDTATKTIYGSMAENKPEWIVPQDTMRGRDTVDSGAFISALHTEISALARQLTQYQPTPSSEVNYNVEAHYANAQSPASVAMDMRALVALSRGA